MKQFKIIFYYEWLHFKAEKSMLIFSMLLLLSGLYGIYSGKREMDQQRHKIAELDGLYRENIREMKEKYPDSADAGDIGYYHAAFSKNLPDACSALSVGQRDVNPAYLKIRLLAVQNQLYNSENTNPNKLATGSFDLAFVFVFILPLFIIALSFNMLSAEKEQGTLAILLSQPLKLSTLLLAKLLFRFTLIFVLTTTLSLIGIAWLQASMDLRLLIWILATTLYSSFWLACAFYMVVLQKSSAFNAISLLGVWLLLAIILPTLINVIGMINNPVTEGLELSLKQRQEVHAGWDKPKAETMQKFYALHPQFSDTTSVKGRFEWRWYYAFQELGDQSVATLYQNYRQKMEARQAFTTRWGGISPAAVLQGTFNALAATDLKQHLEFVNSTKDYHDKLKAFYYPFLFRFKKFAHSDFAKEPQHVFKASPDWTMALNGMLMLLIATATVAAFGSYAYLNHTKEIK